MTRKPRTLTQSSRGLERASSSVGFAVFGLLDAFRIPFVNAPAVFVLRPLEWLITATPSCPPLVFGRYIWDSLNGFCTTWFCLPCWKSTIIHVTSQEGHASQSLLIIMLWYSRSEISDDEFQQNQWTSVSLSKQIFSWWKSGQISSIGFRFPNPKSDKQTVFNPYLFWTYIFRQFRN